MQIQAKITFKTRTEKAAIESLAQKAGLSLSNYVRNALGLEPLTHGATLGRRLRDEDELSPAALYHRARFLDGVDDEEAERLRELARDRATRA